MPQPALPVRRHPGGGERACRHAHYAVVDLALDTLAAARSFGVEELLLLTQFAIDACCCSTWTNLEEGSIRFDQRLRQTVPLSSDGQSV
uniref:Uncharacterized protein n=1 Tax=Zea mays TaxID=4577 RepID=A0A804RAA0_MAIZE